MLRNLGADYVQHLKSYLPSNPILSGHTTEIELVILISLNTRRDTDFTTMTRNHPELVQILEIFIYSENTGILPIERTTIRMVNYNQQQESKSTRNKL